MTKMYILNLILGIAFILLPAILVLNNTPKKNKRDN